MVSLRVKLVYLVGNVVWTNVCCGLSCCVVVCGPASVYRCGLTCVCRCGLELKASVCMPVISQKIGNWNSGNCPFWKMGFWKLSMISIGSYEKLIIRSWESIVGCERQLPTKEDTLVENPINLDTLLPLTYQTLSLICLQWEKSRSEKKKKSSKSIKENG